MKTIKVMFAAAAVLVACRVTEGFAGELNPGDDMATVTAVLGEPKGHIRAGTAEWYFYDRGEVRMRDGKVIFAELVSEDEAQAIKEERELQRRERARLLSEHQERLRAEGESLLADKLADTAFARQPAGNRLAFWKTFRSRYPDIDVTSLYEQASAEAQRDAEHLRLRQQVADMELRVREAEARTRRAEQIAEEARNTRFPMTYIVYPTVSGPSRQMAHPGIPGAHIQRRRDAPLHGGGPIIRYHHGPMQGSVYGGSYDFGTFYGPMPGSDFIRLP